MQSKAVKTLIKEIAVKYGFKEEEILEMVKTPFYLVSEVMRNSDRAALQFPSIRIPNFALFYCTEGRREFYKKLNSKNNEGNSTDRGSDKSDSSGDTSRGNGQGDIQVL